MVKRHLCRYARLDSKEGTTVSRVVITPNLHVALVHFPIALLVAGTLIEVLAFMWRRGTFRATGRWMIALGALSALPAAGAGLLAMWEMNRPAGFERRNDLTWAQTRAGSPIQGERWAAMQRHGATNATVSVVLVAVVVTWVACSNTWRRRLHVPLMVVVVICVSFLAGGAWIGWEMVHRHGVGVIHGASGATTQAAAGTKLGVGPLELHVILACAAISLAAISLGLSLRAAVMHPGPQRPIDPDTPGMDYAAAFVPRAAGEEALDDIPPREQSVVEYDELPAGRFWLLTALITLAAALLGIWALAQLSETSTIRGLQDVLVQRDAGGKLRLTRRLAHVSAGAAVVALPLVLALIARFATRRRFVIAGLSLVLLLALAAEVWLGALLMLDSPKGMLGSFNVEAGGPATQAAPATGSTRESAAPRPTTFPIDL